MQEDIEKFYLEQRGLYVQHIEDNVMLDTVVL